jgi:hypothetical protein
MLDDVASDAMFNQSRARRLHVTRQRAPSFDDAAAIASMHTCIRSMQRSRAGRATDADEFGRDASRSLPLVGIFEISSSRPTPAASVEWRAPEIDGFVEP